MAAVPLGEAGRKLRKRIAANRAHLFVFIDQSGRALYQQRLRAPSPPQRDLPQGDQWIPLRVGRRGPMPHSALVVSTAKANRASVLDVLRFVLACANIPEQLPLRPGVSNYRK